MSFTENLYLKRMIQQLHEENLKLKSLINEVYRGSGRPQKEQGGGFITGGDPHATPPSLYPRNPLNPPGFGRPQKQQGGGFITVGPHQLPNFPNPRSRSSRIISTMHDLDALHPANPLRVDDADTGSAAHPGEEGAVDDMPTHPPTKPKFVDLNNPNYPQRGR